MSGGRIDRSEAYAYAILGALTGAQVDHLDVNGAPDGMVDGALRYPDGRTGTVEVTRLATKDSMHLEHILNRTGRKLSAPGTRSWIVAIDDLADQRPLFNNYEEVVMTLEAHGVDDVTDLPAEVVAASEALRWASVTSVRFDPLHPKQGRPHPSPPTVRLWRSGFAVWDALSDPIGEAIRDALLTEHVQGKLAKLLATSADERHLFLVVASGGLTEAAQFELHMPERLPTTDVAAPDGLTHIWVTSGWGETILVWRSLGGWDQLPLPVNIK